MCRLVIVLAIHVVLVSARYLLYTADGQREITGGRRQRAASPDTEGYLEKFGYLQHSAPSGETRPHSEDDRRHAISTFQKMARINVTGEMNPETVDKMIQPRCGFPDITPDFDPTKPVDYNAVSRWKVKPVTWKITTYSSKLPNGAQRMAIVNGFNYWANASGMELRETEEKANINIMFAAGDHGDGVANQFHGKGGVLAHAYLPASGDTHFDADEDWTLHSNNGTELESVAAHEFGHAFGLHHSVVKDSIMAPFYRSYIPGFKLHADDVAAIQSLYGPPTIVTSTAPTTEMTTMTAKQLGAMHTTAAATTTAAIAKATLADTLQSTVSSACTKSLHAVFKAMLVIITMNVGNLYM